MKRSPGLVGTDVHVEDGVVLVDVLGTGGRVARVVPVHHLWAAQVLESPEDSGDGRSSGPTDRDPPRGHSQLHPALRGRGSSKFTPQRLRITWLVGT